MTVRLPVYLPMESHAGGYGSGEELFPSTPYSIGNQRPKLKSHLPSGQESMPQVMHHSKIALVSAVRLANTISCEAHSYPTQSLSRYGTAIEDSLEASSRGDGMSA